MAATPRLKCFDADGNYEGSVKHFESAAALMAVLGDGSTVRTGHRKADIIYKEGRDGDSAESWDSVSAFVLKGIKVGLY
jgi:hypothetical protein